MALSFARVLRSDSRRTLVERARRLKLISSTRLIPLNGYFVTMYRCVFGGTLPSAHAIAPTTTDIDANEKVYLV